MPRRFEQLVDPCGNWMVWDRSVDMPATYQGQVLAGLAAKDARKLATLLNLMDDVEGTDGAAGSGSAASGKQNGTG